MTTLVFRDGVMAADTQATDYNTTYQVQKVWRLPDGGVAGLCGDASKGYAGVKWLAEGEVGDPPSIKGAYIVIARPDGSLWLAEDHFPAFPVMDKMIAHGCGRDFARAALAEGKSAVEAVFAAIKHDLMTSAPVMSLRVVSIEFPEAEFHYSAKPSVTETKKRARKARP